MIKSMSINGLRGFGEERNIIFAIPDNEHEGSGLTFLVGSNNTGKTTVLEALRCFNSDRENSPSFSERKRNMKCENGEVHLSLTLDNDKCVYIDTVSNGGSETEFRYEENNNTNLRKIFVLQSRRYVEYEFGKDNIERDMYLYYQQVNTNNRMSGINGFNARLFKMQKNKPLFNELLREIIGYDLEWMIDKNDNGTYYLKFIVNGEVHSSEGLGDGIWSVFTICDALYDSQPEDIIAIDEPELSLHPAYQKRIMKIFMRFSKDRQIILSTHSPYFVNFHALVNGAYLHRTVKNNEGNIDIFSLTSSNSKIIKGLMNDLNQPHTLGLEAKEIFFLEDNIILTEGQEDVVMYNKAAKQLNLDFKGTFFGWGSGGASNISQIASVLQELGYKKIFALFDGDKAEEKEKFCKQFDKYDAYQISTLDIRDKYKGKELIKGGMMTIGGLIKEDKKEELSNLIGAINEYFINQ